MDLPRLVMRRASVLAVAVLGLALVLGLARMDDDIDQEVAAARTLAQGLATLPGLATLDDAGARARLQAWQAGSPLRHLRLQVLDAQGQPLLQTGPAAPHHGLLQPLLDAHRRWQGGTEAPPVRWPLARPDGAHWTVVLQTSHEGERQEALVNLLGMLGLLLLAVAGLLLVMRWNLQRAFAPLQPLLQAIAGIERQDTRAVRQLPPMPVRELDRVAQALRHLAQALEEGESERRLLAQRVITLQEDERARLARELHDEFGQHLTALQVDAAWLARRVHADPAAADVVQSLVAHGRHIQQQLRSVLARLQPLPGLEGDAASAPVAPADLDALLQALGDGWSAAPSPAPRVTVHLDGPAADDAAVLPSALALTVYRITQEALTNAARHSQAGQVRVRWAWRRSAEGPQAEWEVADDGVGVADPAAALRRGSGLAGMKERVWALGGELAIEPTGTDAARPGLRLRAAFGPAAFGPQWPNDQRSPATTVRGAPGA